MKGITPDRWKKIDAILDEALDLEEEKRVAFVRERCSDDAELCRHVLSMLGAGEKAVDFLEGSRPEDLQKSLELMASSIGEAEDENDPDLHTHMGPYLLVKRLGRGGMGSVYLGSRDDAAFEKFVAVKVIRRGMASDEILSRFRNERRILAGLIHPNIARLLDGGATDDGRSYFVMDYVEGKSLIEYCEEKTLSIDDRLVLFKSVCSAVHYAHQKLIVHRDLKPGNILVTDRGEVKLLDFGIAKMLDTDEADFTVPVTATEVRVMTPEYASPEQARGEQVTTASDVYQLGILLYELLTGSRPYSFSNRGRAEIEQIICESQPERPSTAITLLESAADSTQMDDTRINRLRKELSGDLDNIILMALRKEPDRRYQSADHFLQDIDRFLTGMPVHAQSDTFRYRTRKFIRRHRVGVLVSALISVTIVVSLILSVRFSIVVARQNDAIRIESAKKDQVKDLLLEMFNVSDPELARGREITARDMLVPGAERAKSMLNDQPDVQAEMFDAIGRVDLQLGFYQDAEPLLSRALEIRRSLAKGADTKDLAESLYNAARVYDELDRSDESIEFFQRALAMRRRLFIPPSAAIADVLNDFGTAVYRRSVTTADSLWKEALGMRIELEGPSSRDIAETMLNLAGAKADEGDLDTAEELYRQALKMVTELLGSDHPLVASSLHNLGTVLMERGELGEAERVLLQAIEIRTVIFGRDGPDVARSKSYLGRVYQRIGRLSSAEKLFREVVRVHTSDMGPSHYIVGRDHQVLGNLLLERGEVADGRKELRRAQTIFRSALPPDHQWITEVEQRLRQENSP